MVNSGRALASPVGVSMRKALSALLATLLMLFIVPMGPASAAPLYFSFEDKANMPDLNPEFDITLIEYLEDPSRPRTHIFNVFFAAPIRNTMFADSSWVDLDLHTDADQNADFEITAHSVDNLSRVKNWEAAVWNFDTKEWISDCKASFSVQKNSIQFVIDYECLKLPTEFGISAYSDYIYGDKKSFDYVPEFNDKFLIHHSFGANPNVPVVSEGGLRYETKLIPVEVPTLGERAVFKSKNLMAATLPIYLPDLNNRLSCSHSTVKLVKKGNKSFVRGDTITIESAIEDGALSLNSAMQNPGQVGIREVFSDNYTNTSPKAIALNVALCTSEITEIIPRYLTLDLTLSNPSKATNETIRAYMEVLPTSSTSAAVEDARNYCALGAFETTVLPLFTNNLLLEQTRVPGSRGGPTEIRGTVFRQGLLASNEKVIFYKDSKGKPGSILGSAVTDEQGQFTFKFNLTRSGSSKTTRIYAYIPERTEPFGDLNVAFLAFTFPIDFSWANGGKYVKSKTYDWVPTPIAPCQLALENLNLANKDDDDRHPIAWYIAKKVLFGSKDKKQYVSIAEKNKKEPPPAPKAPTPAASSSNYNGGYSYSGGGTRCTSVRGYYRNGSYVRGHIRCR